MDPRYVEKLIEEPQELKKVLERYRGGPKKIAEIYSPPRIAEHAAPHGMRPGWSLDLSTMDPFDGKPWDFRSAAKRRRAEELLNATKPWLLVGGPPCTDYSVMQNMNWGKMSPAERERRKVEAKLHVDFCAQLYRIQHEQGRLFLHEHPDRATSWKEPSIQAIANLKDVLYVKADQCAFGLQVKDKGTYHLVQKKTGVLTNSPEVAKELSRQCSGQHDHLQLKGGNLTKQAQVYPPELCKAICRGASREYSYRQVGHFMIGALDLVADTLGSVHGGSMRRTTSTITMNFCYMKTKLPQPLNPKRVM